MSKKVKIPGLAHFDNGGAAFGVFPQLSGRRRTQDPEAAKNVPLDVLRGALSGLLGSPGDVEQLGRSLLNWSFGPGGVKVSPETVIPTSSDVEKMLPLRPETQTPVGSAATTLGQLIGGLATGPAVNAARELPTTLRLLGKSFPTEGAGPVLMIGENSPKFNQYAKLKAEQMERAGATWDEIKEATGLERAMDGGWRQMENVGEFKPYTPEEVTASNMDPRNIYMPYAFQSNPMADLYPDVVKNLYFGQDYRYPNLSTHYIPPSPGYAGKVMISDPYDPNRALMHELGSHAVQTREGWAPGTNMAAARETPTYESYLSQVKESPETYANTYGMTPEDKAAYLAYKHQHGEAEARMMTSDAFQTADPIERRSKSMYEFMDVPKEKIVMDADNYKPLPVSNEPYVAPETKAAISSASTAGQASSPTSEPFDYNFFWQQFFGPQEQSTYDGGYDSSFDSNYDNYDYSSRWDSYAVGGPVQMPGNSPSLAQMKMALAKFNPQSMKSMGVNEAIDLDPKLYLAPDQQQGNFPPPGGVATPSGMPIGGIDMSKMQPGQQLMPQITPPSSGFQAPQATPATSQQANQAGQQNSSQSNILQMTRQGQAMNAMTPPQQTPGMAKGGEVKSTRVQINAEGPGKVKGIVVPRHMLEGSPKSGLEGMNEINKARAQVYGAEHREPLTLNKIASMHKKTLEEHFAKPVDEQTKAEIEALQRLRAAKHIGKTANTLDESEKLDTVRHETDEEGRTHVGYAAKGVAGHALYTSGHGKQAKHHILNTCPGQTTGCGGGIDEKGIVDTKRGTCFAPNAEAQYPAAAVRRAAHAQAKHDPAMTNDWILAHTGSLRHAANMADKKNQRTLFRPNVVDETDVSSRHVLRHLNEQRKSEGKPPIIANSYGKTNELHDPENGYYVTHSNVGPKVKHGREITENIGRDRARIRNTVLAADNKGDFKNEQGNLTPPKGSYMVTDVKRGSPLSKEMEKHITHAKYWSTGREESELSPEEKAEGPEGHFGGNGKATTPEKAHYGHTTLNGRRYDYQKQHILHPRLVQVGKNKDGTPHMIPTDSRFKDTEFLPKNRFKTKNGKEAGHILMTTPTESTSNLGHHTPFTHNVSPKHIEHAKANRGEYEIDAPHEQEKARGKEYVMPQPISFVKKAGGGSVGAVGRDHDDFYAFPEQNLHAQYQLSRRYGDDEELHYKPKKKSVTIHKRPDTMRLELMR